MNDKVDLKKIEQKSWSQLNQDGLIEIMQGFLLIIISLAVIKPALISFWVVFFIVSLPLLERIRKRVTYPRIGYAKLAEEEPKKTALGMALYFIICIAAVALISAILAGGWDWDMFRRWTPALGGFIFSGGMIFAASKSGSIRYYFYMVLTAGLGIAISLLNLEGYAGLPVLLFSLGAVLLPCGAVLLLRFTRKYPLPEVEAGNVSE